MNAYIRLSGYGDTYTPETYKEAAGKAGLWTFRNLEFKFNNAMKAIEGNVVIVENTEAE